MKRFFTDIFDEEKANVISFSVFTGSNSEKTLQSLRETSWFVETIDADSKKNLMERARIHDIGNLKRDQVTQKLSWINENKKISLMFSNAHLPTLFALKGMKENFKLLVFDAHSDLHDRYSDKKIRKVNDSKDFSEKLNDATWLRRFCDEFGKENVLLVGLRSDTEGVLTYLKDFNYFTSTFTKKNIDMVKRKISEFTSNSSVYVSVDIDVFDPAIAPAVEYPEPDGLMFDHFKELISAVKGKLIGLDLNCLAYPNTVTEFLACKTVFYTLNLLNTNR